MKVGFVGFTTESTPEVVFPGNLGPFEVRLDLPAVNAEAARLAQERRRDRRARPRGRDRRDDHRTRPVRSSISPTASSMSTRSSAITTTSRSTRLRSNGVLVTENRGKGLRFTRDRHRHRGRQGRRRLQDRRFPQAMDHRPDPGPGDPGRDRRTQRRAGADPRDPDRESTKGIPRADQCGAADGRLCESLVGDLVTDAMRSTYRSIGAQFAITNSGGLRADLTCPGPGHSRRLLPVVRRLRRS